MERNDFEFLIPNSEDCIVIVDHLLELRESYQTVMNCHNNSETQVVEWLTENEFFDNSLP
jgi:hypothetical protein